MGRLYSKLYKSSLVSLCKQRKEIIKRAKYCRYDFVTSFDIYLDSIFKLGNSLNQYVEQEFVIFDHSCLNFEFSSSDSDLHHFHCDKEQDNEDLCSLDFSRESTDELTYACKHHVFDTKNMKNDNDHMHMSHEEFGHYDQRKENTQRVNSYQHYGSKPFSMVVSPNHVYESHNHGISHQKNVATNVSQPTPPPPQAYSWDFLYPFSMNYEAPNYVHYEEDEREIREREGIPDLEDENELSSGVSPFCHNGMEDGIRHDSGNGNSNVLEVNDNKDLVLTTEEIFNGNLEPKVTIEECESVRTSSVSTPNSSSRMSLKEAVLDIKNGFEHICDCGREFSSLIEAGKLPYHSPRSKLRAFASCFLGRILPSISSCLHPSYMSYHPVHKTRMSSKSKMQSDQDHTKFGDLSSTLEMLYMWEKKLYAEVLGEEKLRIRYDKQQKKLKELDRKGAEPDKIDDTLVSIKILHAEISVAVTSISVISREINELIDDKLLPELNKLIDGLIELWKIMSTCHQKQFQAISKAHSHVHIIDPMKKKKPSLKATLRLEKVILIWGKCFSNFFNKQKSLVKHLNDWQQKCTPKETEDAMSPPIFRLCSNWYNAINKVSEVEVSKAINNFASNLHEFYEKLKEEKALKVKVKHLFKDYNQRFRSYCKKNEIESQQYYYFFKMKASEDFDEDEIPKLNVSDENLATSRVRLIEERKRHEQVIKHVNDVASSFLQQGLTQIFEALSRFSLENLRIYEQLRLPNSAS